MAKDLTRLMAKPLDLHLGEGRDYTVALPSAEAGVVLAKLFAFSKLVYEKNKKKNPDAKDSDPFDVSEVDAEALKSDLTPEWLERLEGPFPTERLALGQSVVEKMLEDGLPEHDIVAAGRYAALFWMFGEKTADAIVADDFDPENAEELAEFPKQQPSGPSTESETHSLTEPTADTDPSLPTSAKSSSSRPRKKKS